MWNLLLWHFHYILEERNHLYYYFHSCGCPLFRLYLHTTYYICHTSEIHLYITIHSFGNYRCTRRLRTRWDSIMGPWRPFWNIHVFSTNSKILDENPTFWVIIESTWTILFTFSKLGIHPLRALDRALSVHMSNFRMSSHKKLKITKYI